MDPGKRNTNAHRCVSFIANTRLLTKILLDFLFGLYLRNSLFKHAMKSYTNKVVANLKTTIVYVKPDLVNIEY